MAVSTKEQTLLLLALIVIYLGIYTMRSSRLPDGSSSDATWAGLFSITLGVFTILTVLFAQPGAMGLSSLGVATVGQRSTNMFSLIAAGALAASAFFNYKLVRAATDSTMRLALYAQIAAHLLIVLVFFVDFGRFESGGIVRSTVPVVPGYAARSPRMPMSTR